ncbi:MAG: NHL repeat-containing protein [Candidatus Cybelea sp.]|jgi:sugar lactone lactonase YvrE
MIRLSHIKAVAVLIGTSAALAGCSGGSSVPLSPGGVREPAPLAETASKKTTCAKKACIYVGNFNNSVTVYPLKANGNVAPVQQLSGSNTGLKDVWAVAVDDAHNIYAANYDGNLDPDGDLTVYASGSNGNVAPIATIDGPASGDQMLNPSGIALDAAGNIYATGYLSKSVSVYAPGSNGTPTPIQYIEGGNTGLSEPTSLAVAPDGMAYVTDWDTMAVTVYAPGANGNVAPIRTISGSNTGIYHPSSVAVDRKGVIYVSSAEEGSPAGCCVTVYAKGANGNVAPIRTISGSNTELDGPNGIALDSDDNVYVSDYFTNSVTEYAKNANGNVAPIRTISGSNTLLDEPGGLTVH